MAKAYKPTGTKFWLAGLPLSDLPLSADAGAQKFWNGASPDGLLWDGLTTWTEAGPTFPSGAQRGALGTRFWLKGLDGDMLQLGTAYPEGSQKFWINGGPDIGLWPAPPPTANVPFVALFLAP